MTRTVSVGLLEETNINYVTFRLHNKMELSFFCEDLASYIMSKYSSYLLKQIIQKNYGYFNRTEKQQIYESAKQSFSNIYSNGELNQRLFIQDKLYQYFLEENTDTIVLEGFIRFRLANCLEELEWLVDSVVDEFLVQKEYDNFIAMLKQFVSAQIPLVRTLHVCPEKSGRYVLYDENLKALTESQILGLEPDEFEGYVNDDDLLLSALVSLAPKKVLIHNPENIKNKQLFETIHKLFAERVILCDGCKICQKNNHPIQIKSNL